MANILVTGSDGQLGREIAELTKKRASSDCYYFTDAAELDITDALAVETFVEKNSIDLIINCAAYNKVVQNTYGTFRRAGENSDPDSWIHKGLKALNLAEKAIDQTDVETIVENEVVQYLDNIL